MATRPLRLLMVSAEMESFARTGGLGDVVESLAHAFAALGVDVVAVTPRYGVTRVPPRTFAWDRPVPVRVGWGAGDERALGVLEVDEPARARGGRLRTCLLEDPSLFGARDGVYGDRHGAFGDNEVRFATLSRGALEIAARAWPDQGGPDVIHAHDWHAALAPIYARLTMGEAWRARPSVFTVHNLAFQGVLGDDALDRLGLPRDAYASGALRHEGRLNLMHGAIALCDRVTTVSPTYAEEILTPASGMGLDAQLRDERRKLAGIVNGIDTARFDPRTDAALVRPFDEASAIPAKRACKGALAAEHGIDLGDGPLFASVSRLATQKGIDLLLDLVPFLVERGARVVLVGEGDSALEARLRAVAARWPRRVAARIAFDGALARRVYAGSDFFVVPSRYEPCGLTQMYAMRYGSIPIVTGVGGLRDTVSPIDAVFDRGTGFVAETPTPQDLLAALDEALTLWRDPAGHARAVARAMARDSSWTRSAHAYTRLYRELVPRSITVPGD